MSQITDSHLRKIIKEELEKIKEFTDKDMEKRVGTKRDAMGGVVSTKAAKVGTVRQTAQGEKKALRQAAAAVTKDPNTTPRELGLIKQVRDELMKASSAGEIENDPTLKTYLQQILNHIAKDPKYKSTAG